MQTLDLKVSGILFPKLHNTMKQISSRLDDKMGRFHHDRDCVHGSLVYWIICPASSLRRRTHQQQHLMTSQTFGFPYLSHSIFNL